MPPPTIAILGAGPAGCTLAALLAEEKMSVVIFDDEKRPGLLVGESLIPAIIPILRALGIEDRVAAVSKRKPGASFLHREGLEMHFDFRSVEGVLPTYSYNVPRPQFDDLIRDRANELGALFIKHRARLIARPGDSKSELLLDDAALAAAGLDAQPALIVDAAGRGRNSARALGIGAKTGPRRDQAHFAHFHGIAHPYADGQIVITYHDFGWSWRIPLPDCMSFGVVMGAGHAARWGRAPGERLQRVLEEEPRLAPHARGATRVTDAFSYTNYQLVSDRAQGPGWASIGDSFGFVDPMLSPGVFLAMEAASSMAKLITRHDITHTATMRRELAEHERVMRDWVAAWQELIGYFYDGRIASFFVEGNEMRRRHPGAFSDFMERSTARRIACMASGATTRSRWNRKCLAQCIRLLTAPVQHAAYAVAG